MKNLIAITLFALTLLACKKEEIPEEQEFNVWLTEVSQDEDITIEIVNDRIYITYTEAFEGDSIFVAINIAPGEKLKAYGPVKVEGNVIGIEVTSLFLRVEGIAADNMVIPIRIGDETDYTLIVSLVRY